MIVIVFFGRSQSIASTHFQWALSIGQWQRMEPMIGAHETADRKPLTTRIPLDGVNASIASLTLMPHPHPAAPRPQTAKKAFDGERSTQVRPQHDVDRPASSRGAGEAGPWPLGGRPDQGQTEPLPGGHAGRTQHVLDRKSTRLHSSHANISY